MAITKLQSESLNLADDFAFTGSVSGAGGLIKLINTTTTDATTEFITFDSTYINSTYDNYFITFKVKPANDDQDIRIQFSTSGTFNTGASDYGVGLATEGTALNDNDFDKIAINSYTSDGIGNASGEGASGHCYLYNPADSNQITAFSSMINFRNFNGLHGMATGGGVRNSAEANDGIRFYWGTGTFASGSSITLYGVTN